MVVDHCSMHPLVSSLTANYQYTSVSHLPLSMAHTDSTALRPAVCCSHLSLIDYSHIGWLFIYILSVIQIVFC